MAKLGLADVARIQKKHDKWLRKYRNITPGDIVAEHEDIVSACKVARKSIVSDDPYSISHPNPAQLAEGGRILTVLNDPKTFNGTDHIGTILDRNKVSVNIPYNLYRQTTQPSAEDIANIIYMVMIQALHKV